MATVTTKTPTLLGPRSAGIVMTPRDFDRADFVEGWRYELINEVLVVSPTPLVNERDPNEELGRWLRNYRESHPQGSELDCTLYEQDIRTKRNRRRCDRAIWAGLGRLPRKAETPTIIAEFVSSGKRSWMRDYEEKRDEYLEINVKQYWVIDRFQHRLTVFSRAGKKIKEQVFGEGQTYTTDLLPGFELDVAKLLGLADRWPEEEEDA